MSFARNPLQERISSLKACRRKGCAGMPDRSRHPALVRWKQALLCGLAIGALVSPIDAQRGAPSGGGTHAPAGGSTGRVYYPPVYSNPAGVPEMQPMPDIPPIPKPTVPDDEKCFPWRVSEADATVVSVSRLKVPSNARHEFQKACEASDKNKFGEAEKDARGAIEKFQNYSAAWVMLGIILEEEHQPQDASDACTHAVTVDPTYLSGYLCGMELSVRHRQWKQVLDLADLALGLNAEGDAYVNYYRATAYFHMNNLAEAKKSAVQGMEADVNHVDPALYFLMAQIYARQGDTANAIAQLQQLLKHHADRQQEDDAKAYLTKLESQSAAE